MRGVHELQGTLANRAAIAVGAQDLRLEFGVAIRTHRLDQVIAARGLDFILRLVQKGALLFGACAREIGRRRRVALRVMQRQPMLYVPQQSVRCNGYNDFATLRGGTKIRRDSMVVSRSECFSIDLQAWRLARES